MKLNDMRYYKFFMLLFNILNIGTGLLVIGSCILYMREKKAKPEQPSAISRGVLSFFITLALFLIVTAVVGCVGALRQHIKTLYVQICFYIFIISIQVIAGIGAVVINAWVGESTDLRLQFYKNTTSIDEDGMKQQAWNHIQIEFRCCGIDGPHDYAVIHRDIPASCCANAYALRDGGAKRHLHATCLNERSYYMRGCEAVVKTKKVKHQRISGLCLTILILLELVIVVMSLSMVRRIRRQRRQLQQNLQAHFES